MRGFQSTPSTGVIPWYLDTNIQNYADAGVNDNLEFIIGG